MHPSRLSALLMERRQASRVAVSCPGKLLFGAREVACTVNDVSEGGAGLTVGEAEVAALPSNLALLMEGEASPKNCEIAWAVGDRVGVKFK
jgi:PilZ domain